MSAVIDDLYGATKERPVPSPGSALDSASGKSVGLSFTGSEGPELPPLLAGLPNTPIRHCKALIATVIWSAIEDRDVHWIASPHFTFFMTLIGFEYAVTLDAKRRLLASATAPRRLYVQPNFLGDDL